MRNSWIGLAALGAVVMQPAMAGTFALGVDASGRLDNYTAAVYAEVGANWGLITNEDSIDFGKQADGFFCASDAGGCGGKDAKVGSGVVVFRNGGDFANLGTITYNDSTGAITGLVLNAQNYIDISTSNPFAWNFTTRVNSVNGTVSLTNGVVTDIQLNSSISFLLGGIAPYRYDGSFNVAGNSFALDVTGRLSNATGELGLTWDLDGTVNNVTPVPEPATYAMMGLGALLIGSVARRRRGAVR